MIDAPVRVGDGWIATAVDLREADSSPCPNRDAWSGSGTGIFWGSGRPTV